MANRHIAVTVLGVASKKIRRRPKDTAPAQRCGAAQKIRRQWLVWDKGLDYLMNNFVKGELAGAAGGSRAAIPAQKVTSAIVTAAGLGTRMWPATRVTQKELLCVIDRPALDYVLDELANAGIERVIVPVGRHDVSVGRYLAPQSPGAGAGPVPDDHHGMSIQVTEALDPLGLGHSLLKAYAHLDGGTCAVALGDNLIDPQVAVLPRLMAEHRRTGKSVIAVTRVSPHETSRYGCAQVEATDRADVWRIRRIVEKPAPASAPSDIVCIGRYVLTPGLFDVLAEAGPGLNGEVQLSEAIDRLADSDLVHGVNFDDVRYDIGSGLGLARATIEIGLRRSDIGQEVAAITRQALAGHLSRLSQSHRPPVVKP